MTNQNKQRICNSLGALLALAGVWIGSHNLLVGLITSLVGVLLIWRPMPSTLGNAQPTSMLQHYIFSPNAKQNIAEASPELQELVQYASTVATIVEDLERPAKELQLLVEDITNLSIGITQSAHNICSEVEQAHAHSAEIGQAVGKHNKDIQLATGIAQESASNSSHHERTIAESQEIMSKISQKVKLIDEIAYQTHLLSINASIEAKNAGASGGGFTVVAREVGSLAEKAKEAAADITSVVSKNEDISHETLKHFTELSDLISQTSTLLADIANMSTTLDKKSSAIMSFLNDIAESATENAGTSNKLSKLAKQVQHHASELSFSAQHFEYVKKQAKENIR